MPEHVQLPSHRGLGTRIFECAVLVGQASCLTVDSRDGYPTLFDASPFGGSGLCGEWAALAHTKLRREHLSSTEDERLR